MNESARFYQDPENYSGPEDGGDLKLRLGPNVSECDNCNELVHDSDCTLFVVSRRDMFCCPVCTEKKWKDGDREVL